MSFLMLCWKDLPALPFAGDRVCLHGHTAAERASFERRMRLIPRRGRSGYRVRRLPGR